MTLRSSKINIEGITLYVIQLLPLLRSVVSTGLSVWQWFPTKEKHWRLKMQFSVISENWEKLTVKF